MTIVFRPSAEKDLARLDGKTRKRVLVALDKMLADPRASDLKKIAGEEKLWRLRAGDYRIIMEIDSESGSINILVLWIAHRKEVYRKL